MISSPFLLSRLFYHSFQSQCLCFFSHTSLIAYFNFLCNLRLFTVTLPSCLLIIHSNFCALFTISALSSLSSELSSLLYFPFEFSRLSCRVTGHQKRVWHELELKWRLTFNRKSKVFPVNEAASILRFKIIYTRDCSLEKEMEQLHCQKTSFEQDKAVVNGIAVEIMCKHRLYERRM